MFSWYNRDIKAPARCQSPGAWPNLRKRSDMPIIPHAAGVYKITCTANGKVYIGSTVDLCNRWREHRNKLRAGQGISKHFQNAWNKYGESAFTFEVVELVMFVEELRDREQYWLDRYQAYNSRKGFNKGRIAASPFFGQTHDDAAIEKIRAAARDDMTPEKLAKMEAARRDWYTSDDAQKQFRRMSDRAAEQLRTREPETRICDYCGEPFETRARSRKVRFCSIPCKAKARWDSGRDNVERVCAGVQAFNAALKANPIIFVVSLVLTLIGLLS